jgi:glycosyltransferase involved in cell wall biosynthesis
MSKRSILFVQHTSNLCGSALSLLYIIRKIDKSVYDTSVMFLGGTGDVIPLFEKEDVDVIKFDGLITFTHARGAYVPWFSKIMIKNIMNIFKSIGSIRKFEKFLKKNNFDLVHLNTSVLIIAAIAAKSLGKKIIWHIREEIHPGVFGFRKYILRNIYKKNSDIIISISKTNAEKLSLKNKVKVVYNYVDFDNFKNDRNNNLFLKSLNINSAGKVFCMLGGTVHNKGAHILLKAAKIVLKKYPNTYFLIAGYPLAPHNPYEKNKIIYKIKNSIRKIVTGQIDMHKECQNILLKNEVLDERIKFIGLRNDINKIISCSNALIWPATQSHFARPVIEAFSLSKPVIASDFQSTREIIKQDHTGLLFQPNNYQALSNNIIRLIENPVFAKNLGKNGYKEAVIKYNAIKNSKKIFQYYDDLYV